MVASWVGTLFGLSLMEQSRTSGIGGVSPTRGRGRSGKMSSSLASCC